MGKLAPKPSADAAAGVRLGALRHSIGFLLRVCQVRLYDQFYERLGDSDLRPGEFSLLWVISQNPGIKQGVLAQTLAIKPAHMTKTVRRCAARGLLHRVIPEDDRRSVQLSLTLRGTDFVTANSHNFFGPTAYNTHSLTEEEAATLAHLLRRFCGLPDCEPERAAR
ncbi:MarR family winged helix-turn-helix transcriptional regulator [Pseudooceanicola sediminis]|uniref:MarR family winged helix-turn-helix transcriptional regulator n=1 Tax=Pseudooceanicola sediminis TaxID=2211117 RepID=UPI001314479A|nr:MarR family transcriptional regulator [Pseudooceanicola sediminis]